MNCAQPMISGTMVEVREAVMGHNALEIPEIRFETMSLMNFYHFLAFVILNDRADTRFPLL
jgi:hypothetical protein